MLVILSGLRAPLQAAVADVFPMLWSEAHGPGAAEREP